MQIFEKKTCISTDVCYPKDVVRSEMRTHTGCTIGGVMQFPTKRPDSSGVS